MEIDHTVAGRSGLIAADMAMVRALRQRACRGNAISRMKRIPWPVSTPQPQRFALMRISRSLAIAHEVLQQEKQCTYCVEGTV